MRKPITAFEDTFWGGRNASFNSDDQKIWFEKMRDKRWIVPNWPVEFGGAGMSPEVPKVKPKKAAKRKPKAETPRKSEVSLALLVSKTLFTGGKANVVTGRSG